MRWHTYGRAIYGCRMHKQSTFSPGSNRLRNNKIEILFIGLLPKPWPASTNRSLGLHIQVVRLALSFVMPVNVYRQSFRCTSARGFNHTLALFHFHQSKFTEYCFLILDNSIYLIDFKMNWFFSSEIMNFS